MRYESLNYKGYEIKIIGEKNEEYFVGSYVTTIWFPDIVRAKDFIDRMTVDHQMTSL